ncbi:hypothetical protein ACYHJB_000815 [Klebsiella michiganensis]
MGFTAKWFSLEASLEKVGAPRARICLGQHIINETDMVIGHLSTPFGAEPEWVFYDRPMYKASDFMVKNSIPANENDLFETLFLASIDNEQRPFRTSTELHEFLSKINLINK